MPITPLNIEEFATEDELFVFQMIEPIVMEDDINTIPDGKVVATIVDGNVVYTA